MNHPSNKGDSNKKAKAYSSVDADSAQDQLAYIQELAAKLLDGTITAEQREILEHWYDGMQQEVLAPLNVPESVALSEAAHRDKIRLGIQEKIKKHEVQTIKEQGGVRPLYRVLQWTAAAVLLILVLSPWWSTYFRKPAVQQTDLTISQPLATPGRDGAVLKLPDGSLVVLDSLKDGQVFKHGALSVVKKEGTLQYLGDAKEVVYNDIITNKGRQWKMFLPDGSEVYLNAGSSLHFPVSFNGQSERIVTLKGEAYFKVVHNDQQPFKVIAGNQVIEDIGTSFNVNAYEDEKEIKTTLVEGALKVNDVLLAPGWQASTNHEGHIKTVTVNTDDVTAWLSGQLSLNGLSLEELMREISRWYNVEIVYNSARPKKAILLSGMLDKTTALVDIVKSLKDFGIDVELKDDKLYINN